MNFKYGDLIVKCGQCGDEQLIEEAVTDGRAIYLFNDTDSYLRLKCDKCETSMEMRMRESTNIDPDLLIEDATILEETVNPIVQDEELPKEVTTEEVI